MIRTIVAVGAVVCAASTAAQPAGDPSGTTPVAVANASPAAGSAGPPRDRIAPVAIRIVPAEASAVRHDRNEFVCRTMPVAGSLIAKHKACLTRWQWSYVDDMNQADARHLVATAVGGVGP